MTVHLACLHLGIKSAVLITQVHCPKAVIKILNYFQATWWREKGPLSPTILALTCAWSSVSLLTLWIVVQKNQKQHIQVFFFFKVSASFSPETVSAGLLYLFTPSTYGSIWHKAVLVWGWINDLVKIFGLCWARRNLRSHSVLTVKEMKECRWHVQVHTTKYRSPDPLFTLHKPQLRK